MERGQMRCEVNISLNMGTKVEIKNLNSFRAMERAIDYEIKRQTGLLESGEEIKQETRGWDGAKQKTFSQRLKEEAHDYRYFPEPDLPALDLKKLGFQLETEFQIPELPAQKRGRFKKEFNLQNEQIEILIRNKKMSDFFEEAVSEMQALNSEGSSTSFATLVFNYLTSDLAGLMNEKYLPWEELRVTPHAFGELVGMAMSEKISSAVAKDVLRQMVETGQEPGVIVGEKGLEQTSDRGFIEEAVEKAIEKNPKALADYKKGKEEALQFFVGQVMRETKGKAAPEIIKEILKKNI
jgi:aspartyl-tRNA(Asn)/glutamyl-tRNA(Gln) amidotransferase subunit B